MHICVNNVNIVVVLTCAQPPCSVRVKNNLPHEQDIKLNRPTFVVCHMLSQLEYKQQLSQHQEQLCQHQESRPDESSGLWMFSGLEDTCSRFDE